jgi:hypothetical protein
MNGAGFDSAILRESGRLLRLLGAVEAPCDGRLATVLTVLALITYVACQN